MIFKRGETSLFFNFFCRFIVFQKIQHIAFKHEYGGNAIC
nr:MAG TPA: hypothetical protein [Caudoviricetes sp.]